VTRASGVVGAVLAVVGGVGIGSDPDPPGYRKSTS
jgi:hypothetical protein